MNTDGFLKAESKVSRLKIWIHSTIMYCLSGPGPLQVLETQQGTIKPQNLYPPETDILWGSLLGAGRQ